MRLLTKHTAPPQHPILSGHPHTVPTVFRSHNQRLTPVTTPHSARTHTHMLRTARQERRKKSGERKLLRNSRAVLDVFRSVGREWANAVLDSEPHLLPRSVHTHTHTLSLSLHPLPTPNSMATVIWCCPSLGRGRTRLWVPLRLCRPRHLGMGAAGGTPGTAVRCSETNAGAVGEGCAVRQRQVLPEAPSPEERAPRSPTVSTGSLPPPVFPI